jgi:hypothetical protein
MDIRIFSVKQTSQISHTRIGAGQSGHRDIPIAPVEGYPRSADIRADRPWMIPVARMRKLLGANVAYTRK